MKIAVSSHGKNLNAELDPRFGRCACFLIVDPDDMSFEVFDNESGGLNGGAGSQSAQFVASKGVNAVITGNCGPNAVQTLSAAGITLFVGQSGTIRDVVNQFKKGSLKPTEGATSDSHFGMGEKSPKEDLRSWAFGPGMGMRRRKDLKGGKRRMNLKTGEQTISEEEELSSLKKHVKTLNIKMRGIIERTNDAKKKE
jgi:predicted Fe-Mo cluster-binding NifX family protein